MAPITRLSQLVVVTHYYSTTLTYTYMVKRLNDVEGKFQGFLKSRIYFSFSFFFQSSIFGVGRRPRHPGQISSDVEVKKKNENKKMK